MNKGEKPASIIYPSFLLRVWLMELTNFQKMDVKHKTRSSRKSFPFSTNTTTIRCFDFPKKNSSKLNRDWDETLTCNVCKIELSMVTNTTEFRCDKCGSVRYPISGSEQSRKDNRAKLVKHDQLNNANTNGYLLSRLSLSAGSSSSFSTLGNKRAVLCGVTYGKRKFKLEGTINDVENMNNLLHDTYKFPTERIRILTEDQKDPNLIPTKKNIMESLNWLVRDCQSEDSLVFYFSGHGLQQPEHHKGEETDGLDETICPVDFLREGMITDNEINNIIIRPLKEGVTLHAIIDACHSGTTLDLAYIRRKEKGSWRWEHNNTEHNIKNTSGGRAICLSACEDAQMAGDSAGFEGKKMNGIMTYLFTKIIKEHSGSQITYAGLMEKIHEEIVNIRQSKFHNSFLRRIFNRKIDQDPLLSSSDKFDVATTIFKL